MSTRAPSARIVDALSGAKAPTGFIKALAEADEFCREVANAAEIQVRNEELQAEICALRADLATATDQRDTARRERDEWKRKYERRGW